MQPGDVLKIGLPRTDLKVQVGDVAIRPALALGAWLAWKRMDKGVMVMGDLVLTEEEVGPVMARLRRIFEEVSLNMFEEDRTTVLPSTYVELLAQALDAAQLPLLLARWRKRRRQESLRDRHNRRRSTHFEDRKHSQQAALCSRRLQR